MISFLNHSKKFIRWSLPTLVLLGIIVLVIKGYHESQKMKELAQKRETLILYNHELNKKNEEIYRKIKRLKQDPVYLEEIARKEFGLVKPDEIIFFIEEGQKGGNFK